MTVDATPGGARLAGKVALIIGGGAEGPPIPGDEFALGNGRATAMLCAREGASVLVADLKLDLAEETAELIRKEGGRAEAIACDASEPEQCKAAVDAAVNAFGTLHLLVNVVGIADTQSIFDVDAETLDRTYRVNLRSNVFTMKYAIEEMTKAGTGSIVNISSIAALRPAGGGIGYDTTKAAQIALTHTVAVAVASRNIRVNTVILGTIGTPLLHRTATPEGLQYISGKIPIGRLGTPWEVASSIVFLLSDEASFITGTELLVDGAARQTH
jgi:NAD(P)-dependent dehydrogenase (short-subunit alcohol dehydrogenase family)